MTIAKQSFNPSSAAIRDIQILQQSVGNHCPNIHKKRVMSLILATKSVLDGADLSLTTLGRNLDTKTGV
ncbi:hypothetical protein ST37_09610 [Vibrio sp. qd031]|nr:hypothetical protein ST37_09610 [Vibrio sp. qd031]